MLIVNLFVIHRCSLRKYSRNRTIAVMSLCVVALFTMSYLLISNSPGFGSGNGLFVFCGFLFIIPVKYLYMVPGVKIVTIACFSWSYTFILFILSVNIGKAIYISGWSTTGIALMLQTFLYIITFMPFLFILKTKFIYVIEHIGKKEANAFMLMTMMWFWCLFIINLSYVYPGIKAFQVLSILTVAVGISSSFYYIYMQVNSGQTIQKLEEIAYKDELTQLRSRIVLSRDAEDLISRKIPFHIVFFDLDKFKSINDRYGHSVGDKYLSFFAYEVKIRIGNHGGFYRVAGDEFVCIVAEGRLDNFLEKLAVFPKKLPHMNVNFLGFSYGIAHYPSNGSTIEEIIEYADMNMYEMKSNKNCLREIS
jgi:diguanylate cyclase (GGDEF)-like protein